MIISAHVMQTSEFTANEMRNSLVTSFIDGQIYIELYFYYRAKH